MIKLLIVAFGVFLFAGCASFTPQYAIDAPVEGVSARYPIRVAITPITVMPMSAIGGNLNYLHLNGDAFAALAAKQLENRKVFSLQEPVAKKYKNCSLLSLQELKERGFDALLLCDVVSIQGGRGATPMGQAGELLQSPALLTLDMMHSTTCYAYTTARFRLINVLDGKMIWSGETSAMAYEKSGRLNPTVNKSLKAMIENLIRDIENANFSLRVHGN